MNNAGTWSVTPGVTYTYSFDAMGRPIKLTDNDASRAVDWVKDLVYDPTGVNSQMRYLATKGATLAQDVYYQETKTFNNLLQMTRLTTTNQSTSTTVMDMEYRFSATQNNGKITQQKDWVSGEEVTYQYDSLQRLISAITTGPEWGLNFTFDGFGNRTASTVTKGTGPISSLSIDGNANRITTSGFGYDANGNMTTMPSQTGIAFDVENRLATASGDQYSYAPDNKRIWKKFPNATEEFYFYGVANQKLATFTPTKSGGNLYMVASSTNLYYGSKLIREKGTVVVTDRLGSVRSGGQKYFPYGEEQVTTAQDQTKFGTYYRDSTTGLDYADQRYYSSTTGRFISSDPYKPSASENDPGSWNKYALTVGDPVNFSDVEGNMASALEGTGTGGGLFGGWFTFFFPSIFGGGPPKGFGNYLEYFTWLNDTSVWKQSPQKKVSAWDLRIAAAIADAIVVRKITRARNQYPHHLEVVRDCYRGGVGSVQRDRAYEVRDERNILLRGATFIQEYNYVVSGQTMTSIGTHWTTVTFTDQLARQGNSDIVMYQQFTVQMWGINATPGPVPVMIRDKERYFGTLGIKLEQNVVWINGDDGKDYNSSNGQRELRRCN